MVSFSVMLISLSVSTSVCFVFSALKEACDSVNKGMNAYIRRYRPLRLLSYLAAPWFLPVDIAFSYAVRCVYFLNQCIRQAQHDHDSVNSNPTNISLAKSYQTLEIVLI